MSQYATYNDFRGAVLLMLDGDEVPSNHSPHTVDQMISLGESLVHDGEQTGIRGLPVGPLRASSMEAVLSLTAADNAVALPADCMGLRIAWFDSRRPLEVVPEDRLLANSYGGGIPYQMAQAGDTLIFNGPAADGDVLHGRYYQRPTALKDGLHATFNRYPDLYLYAALYSASPFLGFDRRIPVWQSYYQSLLHQANNAERWRVHGGSSLKQVAR
jgi:hypothetical protein